MDANIWHVYPQNDKEEHSLATKKVTHFDELDGRSIGSTFQSNCKCTPRIMYEDNGVIVVHNSFDGREGLEWTNDIFNSKA